MAKRKHLPVLTAGEKYAGWMPFTDDEPCFDSISTPYYSGERCAEVYATKKDARMTAEDVRRVTIIVDTSSWTSRKDRTMASDERCARCGELEYSVPHMRGLNGYDHHPYFRPADPKAERCGEIVGFLATESNGAGEWRRCQNQRPCMEHPRCAICGRRNDAEHDDNDHEWVSEFAPPASSPDTQREEDLLHQLADACFRMLRLATEAKLSSFSPEAALVRDLTLKVRARLTAQPPAASEEEDEKAFKDWYLSGDLDRRMQLGTHETVRGTWDAALSYARKRGGR